MTTPAIDALAHRAARLSRRRSLLTLGGAVFAATAAAAVEPGSANKRKKNGRKGSGADCQTQEQQRCGNDATECKATVQILCTVEDVGVQQCLAIRECCEECSAGGFLTCFRAAQQA